ncbi:hypothetical protein BXU08_04035 [Sphingomonas sp. LM7]|nr:hypothetical protein BXU08_04035 [Sphingomonas sp. LM7]
MSRSCGCLLTADAFGIMPPIARVSPDQAMSHFLSGYTAKVAATEIGVSEPEATFSTCFMPRHPSEYGKQLKLRIARGKVDCRLVNTGRAGPWLRWQPERRRIPDRSQFRVRGVGQFRRDRPGGARSARELGKQGAL